ncbi:hypothetical protein JTE90_008417 [Oedothorax gibbosus]|uniref:Uncharacterized protein n=1 Tax=Oedothorax gibbosus TaxID=931172 RepID=A0AAV6USS4_9ARAC|nr:hypothetical protein JTE90_008417 [Oedothorax gibbosus]
MLEWRIRKKLPHNKPEFCFLSPIDYCEKDCNISKSYQPFECRMQECLVTNLFATAQAGPILPYCPELELRLCRSDCNNKSYESECINVRNKKNKCTCTNFLDFNGPDRRLFT